MTDKAKNRTSFQPQEGHVSDLVKKWKEIDKPADLNYQGRKNSSPVLAKTSTNNSQKSMTRVRNASSTSATSNISITSTKSEKMYFENENSQTKNLNSRKSLPSSSSIEGELIISTDPSPTKSSSIIIDTKRKLSSHSFYLHESPRRIQQSDSSDDKNSSYSPSKAYTPEPYTSTIISPATSFYEKLDNKAKTPDPSFNSRLQTYRPSSAVSTDLDAAMSDDSDGTYTPTSRLSPNSNKQSKEILSGQTTNHTPATKVSITSSQSLVDTTKLANSAVIKTSTGIALRSHTPPPKIKEKPKPNLYQPLLNAKEISQKKTSSPVTTDTSINSSLLQDSEATPQNQLEAKTSLIEDKQPFFNTTTTTSSDSNNSSNNNNSEYKELDEILANAINEDDDTSKSNQTESSTDIIDDTADAYKAPNQEDEAIISIETKSVITNEKIENPVIPKEEVLKSEISPNTSTALPQPLNQEEKLKSTPITDNQNELEVQISNVDKKDLSNISNQTEAQISNVDKKDLSNISNQTETSQFENDQNNSSKLSQTLSSIEQSVDTRDFPENILRNPQLTTSTPKNSRPSSKRTSVNHEAEPNIRPSSIKSSQDATKISTNREKQKSLEETLVSEENSNIDANSTTTNDSLSQASSFASIMQLNTLKDKIFLKNLRRGLVFTIMVVGESGLGKTTVIDSLLSSNFLSLKEPPDVFERSARTTEIEKKQTEIEERGMKIKVNLIDTPGFNDKLDGRDTWLPISNYVNKQFQNFYDEESGINRRNIYDSRVHACLYFINPSSRSLRPIDIRVLSALCPIVNTIPIIAKSDTLTKLEVAALKKQIRKDLVQHKLKVYDFTAEDEDLDQKDKDYFHSLIPYTVVGSNGTTVAEGKKVLARRYPWGRVEIENPDHCDFVILKTILLKTHMTDLLETTHEQLYEEFRKKKIHNFGGEESGSEDAESKSLLEKRENEINDLRQQLIYLQSQVNNTLQVTT